MISSDIEIAKEKWAIKRRRRKKLELDQLRDKVKELES